MKIGIALVSILTLAAPLTLATPSYAQYVDDLYAVLGSNNPCEGFGSEWRTFAYDGTSNISYCARIKNGNPNNTIAVTDITGVYRSPCSGGFQEFAYDGTADIHFCAKKSTVSSANIYVTNVDAQLGTGCLRGWDRVVFNGRSNISFCALFNRR
ncbi:MAG: hypothetical protein KME50_35980 [Nostoc desertorum CM1-VF14]|nr:hypothetical protein [Nostoc desertorum CM1-VF14]